MHWLFAHVRESPDLIHFLDPWGKSCDAAVRKALDNLQLACVTYRKSHGGCLDWVWKRSVCGFEQISLRPTQKFSSSMATSIATSIPQQEPCTLQSLAYFRQDNNSIHHIVMKDVAEATLQYLFCFESVLCSPPLHIENYWPKNKSLLLLAMLA